MSLITPPTDTSLWDLTPEPPAAPDLIRYAISQGVRFQVDDWRAHAVQIRTTSESEVAMGLLLINQDNVLRVVTGHYYAGKFDGMQ